MSGSRSAWVWLGGCVVLGLLPGSVDAQIPDSLGAAPAVQEVPVAESPDTARRISPGGAFIRSAILPGWGHAEIGATGRGTFYFAVESAAAFMVLKTRSRLSLARERRVLWESVVTARLQADGIEDPVALEAALEEDERVEELRGLEEARGEQREDWIALGIFFMFLGGADAFVSAHLSDFPAPVEVDISGTPTGRVEVAFSVTLGF